MTGVQTCALPIWANISNPVFYNVTISNVTADVSAPYVTFQGIYSPRSFTEEDRSVLYVGADNTLHYPNGAMSINSCRSYFQLSGVLAQQSEASAAPLRIVMNLDNENGATGMEEIRGQMEDVRVEKILKDGVIYIRRGGIIYDAMGKKISATINK